MPLSWRETWRRKVEETHGFKKEMPPLGDVCGTVTLRTKTASCFVECP